MAGKVMFIVPGRLRADCVSGETAGAVRLPNLRRLMAQGVTFANHFTVTAPCGPSRASLLTGRYAMNHRSIRNGTSLADHIPNLAREVGYEPLLFGYTDTSADPVSRAPSDPDLTDYKGVLPGFREPIEMRMAELPDEDADALRAVYFKLATEADNHVGRLLDYLDETGQAGDALVVMTSVKSGCGANAHSTIRLTAYPSSSAIPVRWMRRTRSSTALPNRSILRRQFSIGSVRSRRTSSTDVR